VHAALQVETQRHRLGADRGKPIGHIRSAVERDDVAIAEIPSQRIHRLGLRVVVEEADDQILALDRDRLRFQASLLQRSADLLLQSGIDLGAAGGGHLDRGILRKDVG
jgi:hypothetical protein